ncbi:MAG TPA: alpha/beta hydrolase-fold protein, partial [Pyrinomonadaceae bacterium]|nr:alpha/beta hydrolase-fold protein [Pyrinomonadaceae bacterium]
MNQRAPRERRAGPLARLCVSLLLALCAAPSALAQEGRLVRESVHSRALEKTVTGESPDRSVIVYLPPSYDTSPAKRYPVVYLLHGITDRNEVWAREWTKRNDSWGTIQGVMNGGIAEGLFGEMIVVMPDQLTKWGGSFYTNSTVTGNWEDFTVRELVSHIDGKYRTLAAAASRGLAGHSMGGYGAIKLGMKHPEVYSVVYAMNPAVLGWARDLTIENPAFASVLEMKTPEDAVKGGIYALGAVVVGVGRERLPDDDGPERVYAALHGVLGRLHL